MKKKRLLAVALLCAAAATTINYTTASVVDNTLFPASFNNLEIATGTNSVTLPTSIRVKNALTLTSGKLTLGANNLTAASISGGSSSNYIVTSSTGVLTLNAATAGTLFPIGTATGYAPVTITPASNDTVSALVSATTTGSFTNYGINTNEWTLTPQVVTTAALAFTPTTAANTTSPAIFSGAGYTAKTDAILSGSTYTASGFSLPTTATIFATGGSTVTDVKSTKTNATLIYSNNSSIFVSNATENVAIYNVAGQKVKVISAIEAAKGISLGSGIYIVKTGSMVQKVLVQY